MLERIKATSDSFAVTSSDDGDDSSTALRVAADGGGGGGLLRSSSRRSCRKKDADGLLMLNDNGSSCETVAATTSGICVEAGVAASSRVSPERGVCVCPLGTV